MEDIPFGTGVFSVPEAARMLKVTPRTVGRWFRGYTYRPMPGAAKRIRPPVGRADRDLPMIEGDRDMSFLEFQELVVVTAFLRKGLSLQRIRSAAQVLMEEHGVDRPFAYRRVYTDGSDLFASLSSDAEAPDLIKLVKGDERLQIRAGRIDAPFVEEVRFSPTYPYRAERYYPLGQSVPIVVDPRIAFGAPTIDGTRITVDAVAALAAGSGVETTANVYGLSPKQVKAAVRYAKSLTSAA